MNKPLAAFLLSTALILFSPILFPLSLIFTLCFILACCVYLHLTQNPVYQCLMQPIYKSNLPLRILIILILSISYQNVRFVLDYQQNPIHTLINEKRSLEQKPLFKIVGIVESSILPMGCTGPEKSRQTNMGNHIPAIIPIKIKLISINQHTVSSLLSPMYLSTFLLIQPQDCMNSEQVLISAGDVVYFKAKLKAIAGYENEYGFNRQQYLFAQHVVAKATIPFEEVLLLKPPDNFHHQIFIWLVKQRQIMNKSLYHLGIQNNLQQLGLLLALATGDKQLISATTQDQIIQLGLAHLFVISGLHIGMLFVWLLVSLKIVAICFLAAIKWVVRINVLYFINVIPWLALCLVWLYCLIIGLPPPAERAVFFLTLIVSAMSLKFNVNFSVLVLASLSMSVFIDARVMLTASWWLSAYAMLGITVYLRLFSHHNQAILRPVKGAKHAVIYKHIFHLIVFNFFIFIWMIPLSVYLFNGTSLFSPIINTLAGPVFSLLLMPILFFANLALVITQLDVDFLYTVADKVISVLLSMESFFSASHLWHQFGIDTLKVVAFILLIVFLPILMSHPLWLQVKGLIPIGNNHNFKPVKAIAGFKFLVLLLSFLLVFLLFKQKQWIKEMRISKTIKPLSAVGRLQLRVFDVGQGDAAALIFNNEVNLIDLGPAFPSGGSATASVVLSYLKALNVKNIERMILTHGDADHTGDVNQVKKQAYIRQKYSCEDITSLPSFTSTSALNLTLLWPNLKTWPELNWIWPILPSNARSCVIQIKDSKSGVRILFTGDIPNTVERYLVDAHHLGLINLKSDILMSSHHGSKHSNIKPFIYAVMPSLVIHSAGVDNRFNMPTVEVLQRFDRYGIKQLTTSEHGEIVININASKPHITITTELNKWSPFWKKQNPFSFHSQIR